MSGVLAIALAGGMAAADPAVAQSPRATVIRRATPDSTRGDSIFMFRFDVQESDLMRLMGELMASRQVEERVAQTLRGASDEVRARVLEQQLQSLARRNTMLASTIRLQCARDDMQPEGFMGVNFVGIEMRRESLRGPTLYYFDSTRVVSVEPGSPAQRAGLEANDELVAIGGMDVARPIPLGAVLKPGAKLQVKVLRAGRPREMTVVVGKRADDTTSPCASLDDGMFATRAPQIAIITTGPRDGRRAATADGFSAVRLPPGDTTNVPPRASAGFTFLPPFASSAFNSFAGAQLVPLDADWRDMTGMDHGLLIIRVAPGSPAESVGLRKADVITAVGDSAVTTTPAFWRFVNAGGGDGVTLRVMRARQPVTVVLKVRDRP